MARCVNWCIRVIITFDEKIPDFQWWVTWQPKGSHQEFYEFKQIVAQWANDRDMPIRGRSIYHMDTTIRYMGFQTESDALTFIIIWTGSEQ